VTLLIVFSKKKIVRFFWTIFYIGYVAIDVK